MTPHLLEELSTKIGWSPIVIMGNTMPPREEEDEDEEDDNAGDPAVVREPDED